jgi:HEAT repeat protein
MGRSANTDWNPLVLAMMDHESPDIRFEAARAAGELEISEALPQLMQLTEDDDDDVRMAAIWSLSQIGGTGVEELLEELLEQSEDEEESEMIESALENLAFTEDFQLFSLMDIDEEGELDEDLEEDEEDEE